ncbi:unnamed protein product [Rhodiola kirilowii]
MMGILGLSLVFVHLVLVHGTVFQDYQLSQISLPPSPAHEPSVYPSDIRSKPNVTACFNVKSFGAVGDGVSDDTQAFKMAWDAACQAVLSSSLIVPRGSSFMIQSTIFTGPCRNSITLQIDGTVMPPDGPNLWPMRSKRRQWLVFYRINGMTMQGGGLLDGRGEKWWNLPCKPHKGTNGTTMAGPCDSPVMIRFFMSSNVTVRGLKVRNSPQFHFRFDGCQRVKIDSIKIKSPHSSPNTDGIHIENTNDVKIHNSIISNGDDCVSIGAGCYNVDVRNITCGPSHGISIGSLGLRNTRACVSNITVTNSLIKNSDNGLRIKTWQGGSGSVSRVTFTHIRMDMVKNPIIIDQYYCLTKNCPNQTSAVYITDISYKNIKGTYDTRAPSMRLACSDTVPCTNLTMSKVELLPAQPRKSVLKPFCWNAFGSWMTTRTVPPVYCLVYRDPLAMPSSDLNFC